MKRVFICSAFRAETPEKQEEHEKYARELCNYAIEEGCAPFAPHLFFPQFLSESPVDRSLGIRAGMMWMQVCQELWFGVKYQLTEGMKDEIDHAAKSVGIPIFLVLSDGKGGFTRKMTSLE